MTAPRDCAPVLSLKTRLCGWLRLRWATRPPTDAARPRRRVPQTPFSPATRRHVGPLDPASHRPAGAPDPCPFSTSSEQTSKATAARNGRDRADGRWPSRLALEGQWKPGGLAAGLGSSCRGDGPRNNSVQTFINPASCWPYDVTMHDDNQSSRFTQGLA
jgi:hypothetical protein